MAVEADDVDPACQANRAARIILELTFAGHLAGLTPMPTLSSPKAFEFCEGGTCADASPSADNKHVSCPPGAGCSTGACYCQLFRRAKGSADTVAWDVAHADHESKVKYRPDRFDYKCFCVKPILESEITNDGVTYTVRYQLCGFGSCDITNVPVHDSLTEKHQEVKCVGKCDGECKCTLFRLQVAAEGPLAFDPKDAKWELMAKADKQVKHNGLYVYHCFCLK